MKSEILALILLGFLFAGGLFYGFIKWTEKSFEYQPDVQLNTMDLLYKQELMSEENKMKQKQMMDNLRDQSRRTQGF